MIQSKKQLLSWLAGILVVASSLVNAKEPPKIVVSIKPVQLIVEAITDGVAPVDVLLKPGASPHSHSLKPSDARKLAEADVVFWVGPDMEMFLEKMLSGSKKTLSVPLMEQSKLRLRKNNAKEEELEHEHEHGHDHHHGEYDAHIWLSPNNAISMARTVSYKLSSIDPVNKKKYKKNYKAFKQALQAADKENMSKLEAVRNKPMFVFHDAYGYLQSHYKLNIVDHFTINPEMKPGAKHLNTVQNELKAAGKSCVFREPQFKPPYIDRIIEGSDANIEVLDPLAENIPEGPRGYIDFLNGMVNTITRCFK